MKVPIQVIYSRLEKPFSILGGDSVKVYKATFTEH
jgi:hypothetical protein